MLKLRTESRQVILWFIAVLSVAGVGLSGCSAIQSARYEPQVGRYIEGDYRLVTLYESPPSFGGDGVYIYRAQLDEGEPTQLTPIDSRAVQRVEYLSGVVEPLPEEGADYPGFDGAEFLDQLRELVAAPNNSYAWNSDERRGLDCLVVYDGQARETYFIFLKI